MEGRCLGDQIIPAWQGINLAFATFPAGIRYAVRSP